METRRGGRLVDRPEFKTKPKPVTFLGKDKVSQAIAVMADKNYGSVVIVDSKDKVVGIVTERDIVKKLVNNNMSPKTTKLEDIMTLNPRVANENDDVVDWLRIMSNDRFRRLPVVDADGKIKVIFTQGDFVSYTWRSLVRARPGEPIIKLFSFINIYGNIWSCFNSCYESFFIKGF